MRRIKGINSFCHRQRKKRLEDAAKSCDNNITVPNYLVPRHRINFWDDVLAPLYFPWDACREWKILRLVSFRHSNHYFNFILEHLGHQDPDLIEYGIANHS